MMVSALCFLAVGGLIPALGNKGTDIHTDNLCKFRTFSLHTQKNNDKCAATVVASRSAENEISGGERKRRVGEVKAMNVGRSESLLPSYFPKCLPSECKDFSQTTTWDDKNAICISLKNVLSLYYRERGLAQVGKTSFVSS